MPDDNTFLSTMSAFQGAADLVMGMEARARAQRQSNMALAAQMQQMEFDRDLHPLNLRLLEAEIAGRNLSNLGQKITAYQALDGLQKREIADGVAGARLAGLYDKWNQYRAGILPPDSAPAAPVSSAGIRSFPSGLTADSLAEKLPERLRGLAGDFVSVGQEYNLDPRFLAAISQFETGHGTSSAFTAKNNAMGVSNAKGPIAFNSPADSIRHMAQRLADPNGPYGKARTIDEIGAIYSPPGAGNDPNGTNGEWPSTVGKFYSQLTGGIDAPVASGAPFGPNDVESGQGDRSPAAAMPAWQGPPNPDAPPPALGLLKELQYTIAGFGGLQALAQRHPQRFEQVVEMMTHLESDPQIAAYAARQEEKINRQKAVALATGKIMAAGLPLEKFKGQLEAIAQGLPLDPDALQKNIDNQYALQQEEAKQKANKASSLLAMSNNPLAMAGIRVGSRLSKSQAEVFQAGLADLIQAGDTTGAQELIRDTAVHSAPTAVQNEYAASHQMLAAVADAEQALAEFYKSGKKTGPWEGWQMTEVTGDRDIQALKTRMAIARQAYIKATTGAAMSDSERKTYEEIFPDVTKVPSQNLAQVGQLKAGLLARKQASERAALGSLAPLLDTSGSLLEAAQPEKKFNSAEEARAAISRGDLRKGEVFYIGDQMHKAK